MKADDQDGNHGAQDRVPVKNSRIRTGAKIGPQRFKEITFFGERNPSDHVSQRRAVEDCEQYAGAAEDNIE